MLSVRSLILLSVLVLVACVLVGALSLMRDPDSGGMGSDSYGTQAYGYRALYDTLNEVGIDAVRQLHPPQAPAGHSTILLIAPIPELVGVEPSYLKSLIPWVEQGGRLVVAVKDVSPTGIMAMSADLKNQPSILQILGLDAVDAMPRSPVDGLVQPSRSSWTPEPKPLRDVFSEAWSPKEVLPLTIPVTQQGNLPRTEWPIQQLSLPGDQVGTFDAVDAKPAGTLEFLIAKQPVTLAASFVRGKGEIVLVAEPQLFSNRLLAQADNSILAARLLAPDGQRVFIDEFYHGLSVRGNSLYLLTQPGYAALALGLLFVSCLVIWREAIFLGPSLRDETIGRRDIGEYLRAMGRFFSIGYDSRPFLLKQMREGVLRELSTEQSLPTETQDADLIVSVLARRSPSRAEALRTALRDVDALLESRQDLTEAQTLDALRRLTSCLSNPRSHAFASNWPKSSSVRTTSST